MTLKKSTTMSNEQAEKTRVSFVNCILCNLMLGQHFSGMRNVFFTFPFSSLLSRWVRNDTCSVEKAFQIDRNSEMLRNLSRKKRKQNVKQHFWFGIIIESKETVKSRQGKGKRNSKPFNANISSEHVKHLIRIKEEMMIRTLIPALCWRWNHLWWATLRVESDCHEQRTLCELRCCCWRWPATAAPGRMLASEWRRHDDCGH